MNGYTARAIRQRFLLTESPERRQLQRGQARQRRGLLMSGEEGAEWGHRELVKHPSIVVWLKKRRRRLLGYIGRTATRWILVDTDVLMGLASIRLVLSTGRIVDWRSRVMHRAVNEWGRHLPRGWAFQTFLWTNLALALASYALRGCCPPKEDAAPDGA